MDNKGFTELVCSAFRAEAIKKLVFSKPISSEVMKISCREVAHRGKRLLRAEYSLPGNTVSQRNIGEDELSEIDKRYMKFGSEFEKRFLNQGFDENRSMDDTLELAWDLLSLLPKSELDRMNSELIEKHYRN